MDLGFSCDFGGSAITSTGIHTSTTSLDDILSSVSESHSSSHSSCQSLSQYNITLNPAMETNRRMFMQRLYKRFRSHCENSEHLQKTNTKEIPNFIYEKWIFTRIHYQNLVKESSRTESKALGRIKDPLLPSGELDNSQDLEFVSELEQQLHIDNTAALSIVRDLLSFSNQLIHRMHTTDFSDKKVKIRVKVLPFEFGKGKGKENDKIVAISRGKTSTLKIRQSHFLKLKNRFEHCNSNLSNSTDLTFEECLFVLLERYMALPGSGFQAACLDKVFELLSSEFDVTTECFASPINVFCQHFCSAFGNFGEIDALFSSFGDFFRFSPKLGSFQANPPFVPAVVSSMAEHMNGLLESAKGPLSFVVILPDWDRPKRSIYERKAAQQLTKSKFFVHQIFLMQEEHSFYEGAQHRRDGLFKVSTCQSVVVFLQNEEGRNKWKVSAEFLGKLKKAFRMSKTEKNVHTQKTEILQRKRHKK